jgi:hypothetical protein
MWMHTEPESLGYMPSKTADTYLEQELEMEQQDFL